MVLFLDKSHFFSWNLESSIRLFALWKMIWNIIDRANYSRHSLLKLLTELVYGIHIFNFLLENGSIALMYESE
jgi:hypothetical protein